MSPGSCVLPVASFMANDTWATPPWLFNYATTRFGAFDLDVCALPETAKCQKFFTPEDDGLQQPWLKNNWCNPPYSKITPWVEKAASEASFNHNTVLLLPADVSTKWFAAVWEASCEILIINHRVSFVGSNGSPKFASLLCLISALRSGLEKPNVDIVDLRSLKNA